MKFQYFELLEKETGKHHAHVMKVAEDTSLDEISIFLDTGVSKQYCNNDSEFYLQFNGISTHKVANYEKLYLLKLAGGGFVSCVSNQEFLDYIYKNKLEDELEFKEHQIDKILSENKYLTIEHADIRRYLTTEDIGLLYTLTGFVQDRKQKHVEDLRKIQLIIEPDNPAYDQILDLVIRSNG